MGQKEVIIRKLPLPLQIKLGNDTIITDGFFSLSSKEASQINITSISEDGYATIEILPSRKRHSILDVRIISEQDTFLGTRVSKKRGRGQDVGQYNYYKRADDSIYAIISGKRSRKIELGRLADRNGRIFAIARAISEHCRMNEEFTKKDLIPKIPKHLSYGQTLKALLDVMTIEGYLEKREIKLRGKLREMFKATEKLRNFVVEYFTM